MPAHLPSALAAQLHPSLNDGLDVDSISSGSGKKLWWLCDKGHTWQAPVYSRTAGTGCPYCAGKRPITGVSDLATVFPSLLNEWDDEANLPATPQTVTPFSHRKVQWECSQGHVWQMAISKRTSRGDGCPYCSGQRVAVGERDLASLHPEVAKLWDYRANKDLAPQDVTAGSGRLVGWRCDLEHKWQLPVYKAVARPYCPFCDGRKLLKEFNDLPTLRPDLAKEWHTTKNSRSVEDVTVGSDYHAWWQCETAGHEWQAYVYNRTGAASSGCPNCARAQRSSAGESELAAWLTEKGVKFVQSDRLLLAATQQEVDFYLPDYNLAIEYNGLYWHSEAVGRSQGYHLQKYLTSQDKGVQLLQIWEDEWRDHADVVKAMLTHKLKLATNSIMARKTEVVRLSAAQARLFMSTNHLLGYAPSSAYYGLTEPVTGKVVAALGAKTHVISGEKTQLVTRYATDRRVPGGFTKLLQHLRKLHPSAPVITYSDNMVSAGDLYRNSGFTLDATLKPDYTYLAHRKREHKFRYRIERFKQDPLLEYKPNLTEQELAALNGLVRIWDAGKLRWRLESINKSR